MTEYFILIITITLVVGYCAYRLECIENHLRELVSIQKAGVQRSGES